MTTLPCPPVQWPRFSSLLDTAMEVPEALREDWLARLEGDDAAFRPWLARVLRGPAAFRTNAFLERAPEPPPEPTFCAADLIGPYRLEELLGEGGMGQVWRASRADDGPQREVALKLPQPELLGGPFRARFRRERDVLAALSHRHIAQLYDAGASQDGHPYLALELVAGQPITDYCRATHATIDRRLELMLQVLEALSYAHARLIVHRDIKPSNVLVTEEGGVKLLDFGIAKLLRAEDTGDTALTQPTAMLATPGYAAPEQFSGAPVSVAADVFSAGVLLFELLTGQRPFSRIPTDPLAEAAPLASQRADAKANGAPEGARLAGRLRGDIDAVVARALALAPGDRYASTEAFARDVRRCREGLPVSARRVGWLALAGKFVRRNRVGVALSGVLALAVAGGTAGIAWQGRRAAHEAARATAIKNFLIGLFEHGNPHGGGKPSESMTAKELLDIGADQADTAFAQDPVTEIDLLQTLGEIYDALDDGKRAERIWVRRLELARAQFGEADPRVVDSTLSLVNSYVEFLDEDRALTLLAGVRAPIIKRYGANSLQYAQWLDGHAQALRTTHGGRDAAIADGQAATAIYAAKYADNPGYAQALGTLSDYQWDAEQYAASLATLQKMRAVQLAQHNTDAMDALDFASNQASRLQRLGRFEEADASYAQAQAMAERQTGREGMYYLYALSSRGHMASLHGQPARAEGFFKEAMAISTQRAELTGITTSVRRVYGAALAREGRGAEAVPLLEAALAETKKHLRDEANLRRTQGWLGDAYDLAGRTAEARPLLQAARDEWLRYGVQTETQTLGARARWARFLYDHGEPAPAQAEYEDMLRVVHGVASAPASLAQAGLARIALDRGDLATADSNSAAALRTLDAVTMEYDVRYRCDVWLTRAEVLHRLGRGDQALALAQRALDAAMQYDLPGSWRIARATRDVAAMKK